MTKANIETNWFVRLAIILFCAILIGMIAYNYFFVDPKGQINQGVIVLLSMILVLVLAESFDNFSLGKLISITRVAKKNEVQVGVLEKRNSELLNQLISISSTQSQSQKSTNFFGDYHESTSEQRASTQETDKKVEKEQIEKLLAVVGDNIIISDIVSNIKSELESKGLSTDGDSVKVLIKHLAGTQLLLRFEQIHSAIFGSQIYLLKKLNESSEKGRNLDFVYHHIDHIKTLFPELADWDYEQYLAYLYSHLLITNGENEKVHITNLGVEYLTWLIRNGRSDNKPL